MARGLGGVLASIFVGCIFFFLGGKIPVAYEKLFEGISMYITAGFLFYVIFWLSKKLAVNLQLNRVYNNQ